MGRLPGVRAPPDGRLRAPDDGAVQAFATADGWIMVACPKQRLWERFCDAIGRPELPRDPRFANFAARDHHRAVLVPLLAEVLAGAPTGEWLERLVAHGVPSGPVNDVEGAFADPQARNRDTLVEYEHPTLGVVRGPATPFRLSGGSRTPRRAPALGEHTHEVLHEICGYDAERVRQLAEDGVFGKPSGKEQA